MRVPDVILPEVTALRDELWHTRVKEMLCNALSSGGVDGEVGVSGLGIEHRVWICECRCPSLVVIVDDERVLKLVKRLLVLILEWFLVGALQSLRQLDRNTC